MPKSLSYHEFLIKSLQNPEDVAVYLEAALEEKDPEPELLSRVLGHVVEAHQRKNDLSVSAQLNYNQLKKILTKSGGTEIYTFVEFLESLGFELSVKVKE
ncbi:MAG: transcriptional regulator [Cyanobacteriota bacterium]|nr:transcriptional regulator [Cyanobacteriota bacterium]